MRYIIVKAEVADNGNISFWGAHQIIQKGSANKSIEWIDIKKATGNTLEPENCDFLSFEDADSAESLVESLDLEMGNVKVFEIDAD